MRSLPHSCRLSYGVYYNNMTVLFIHHCCALYCVHTGLTGMPQLISTGPLNTNSNNNNTTTLGDLMPPPSHSLSHEPPVLSHPPLLSFLCSCTYNTCFTYMYYNYEYTHVPSNKYLVIGTLHSIRRYTLEEQLRDIMYVY